jgi:hypothetical protein
MSFTLEKRRGSKEDYNLALFNWASHKSASTRTLDGGLLFDQCGLLFDQKILKEIIFNIFFTRPFICAGPLEAIRFALSV